MSFKITSSCYFYYIIVHCPRETLEEFSANTTRSSGATTLIGSTRSCSGSLKIVHAKEDDLGNAQDINLGGTREKYPNLKNGYPDLKTNIVLHVEAEGCLCWEIYDHPRFVGNQEDVMPGDIQYLKIKPVSVKKVECKRNDYE